MNKGVKIIFWLLVAANIGLFATMKSGVFETRPIVPAQRELNADKIVLLNIPQISGESAKPAAAAAAQSAPAPAETVAHDASEQTKVAEPAKSPAPEAKNVAACYEWGEFTGADVERARKALGKLKLEKSVTQRDTEQANSNVFWVYIAPLKDKEAVTQKIAQLKARGVTDYYVVQEAGEWLNAVSLGMFKTREAAQKYLEELSAKDVRTAKVGERASKIKSTVLVISGVDNGKSTKLTALQKDFPNTELKSTTCH